MLQVVAASMSQSSTFSCITIFTAGKLVVHGLNDHHSETW